jgi:hypothetical protein
MGQQQVVQETRAALKAITEASGHAQAAYRASGGAVTQAILAVAGGLKDAGREAERVVRDLQRASAE